MADLDDTLTALAKIPGAEALAKKAQNALKEERDEVTVAATDFAATKKALKKAEAERDQAKKDLADGAAGKDDALKKAQTERDEWKGKAEASDAGLAAYKRRTALGNELGIQDATRREHALDAAFKKGLPDSMQVDEKTGRLVGATKFVREFHEGASFYWNPDEGDKEPEVDDEDTSAKAKEKRMDKGNGGRPGAKKTLKQGGTGSDENLTRKEKVDRWNQRFGRGKKDDGASAAKH